MTLRSPPFSRVALLIPCQMMASGIEHHLKEQNNVWQCWRMHSLTEARLRLVTSNIEMLVIGFSWQQANWQQQLQFIRALRQTRPGMRIVAIVDVYIPYFLRELSELDVDAIVSQHDSLAEIAEAFAQIGHGTFYCSARIKNVLSDNLSKVSDEVTLRLMELRVLQHLLDGDSVKRTAKLLLRSEKTVMALKGKAMHKLGITHCAELVAMKDMLEYLYLELVLHDDTDHSVDSLSSRICGHNREIKTLPTWLPPPVKVIHSRVVMAGHYPARKE
ncbi:MULTISPECIES: LuxR C-terminal-related transcriptional regulator [unclassified Serratia (in: enterobacteria)]|uniref:LuxR C-terminal-related transcriptional regulator n=1 Tax=unclassified Serratia (in: enterobacteria) TaxID=2647522 RepID=UPI00307621BA